MAEPCRFGFMDESYGVDDDGDLVYVLGLLEITEPDLDRLRPVLLDLPRKRGGVLHFAKEEPDRRYELAEAIGALGLTLTAVVRRGTGRADRARAVALTTLAGARHGRLDLLVIESRGPKPDRTDAALLAALHPPAHRIRSAFRIKTEDPALWVADLVAGAVFQSLARDAPGPAKALGEVARLHC